MKMPWTGRAIVLDDESTAYEDLKDWLLDDDEADVEIAAEYLYAAAHEN